MIRIDDLALFVRTAALGSFTNAAREVDLLPGQVAAAMFMTNGQWVGGCSRCPGR